MSKSKHNVDAIAFQAQQAFKNEDLTRAAMLYRKALKLDKSNPELQTRYGHVLALSGRGAESLEQLERARKQRPNHPPTLMIIAFAKLRMNDSAGALEALDRALLQDSTYAPALLAKVNLYIDSGTPELADGMLDEALTLSSPDPLVLVAQMKVLRASKRYAEGIDLANQVIARDDISDRHKLTARFALGHMLDSMGEYDRAFESFRIANTVLPTGAPTNAKASTELWSKAFHDQLRPTENLSEQPVIVIGMPRSGTTLTEQIISAHPDAGSVGESPVLLQQFIRTAPSNLTTDRLNEYCDEYLSYLGTQLPSNPARVIDKHMNADRTIGLIARMFPKARFIHCLRDPADCCLSAYFQNFGFNLPYARDLRTVGEQYVAHRAMMNHWSGLIDRPIYTNIYEELVDDPEARVRAILAHLGLPWDDACMRFHESKEHVMTASATQVRKPIYSSSKQRWRNYEKHLGPLFDALGEYAPV